MNMENLKIALLGVSHWHVPLYFAGLPEHSVVAVSDDNAALAARVASRFDCPYYTDEKQMIRDTKPDFVFAFAPHVRMYAVAAYLLEQHINRYTYRSKSAGGRNAVQCCGTKEGILRHTFCLAL